MRRYSEIQRKLKYHQLWKNSFRKISLHLKIVRIITEFTNPQTEEFTQRIQGRSGRLRNSNIDLNLPYGIFLSESKTKEIWNLLMGVLLLYIAFATPFVISFLDEQQYRKFYGVDVLIDVFFIIDIIFTLNTAFYTEENMLVTSRKQIFLNYFRHGLAFDLVSSFPFSFIESPTGAYSNMIKFIRLRSAARLLRLSKIFKAFNNEESSVLKYIQHLLGISYSSEKVIKVVFQIFMCIHIAACVWHLLASIDEYGPETWVFRSKNVDSSLSRKYLLSLYWSMITLATIGYGEISPFSLSEKIFALFWMAFALYILSFSISSLSSMLSQIDLKKAHLNEQMNFIDEFSSEVKLSKRIKKELQHTVLQKLEKFTYSYENQKSLISDLTKDIKKEIALTLQGGIAIRFELFFLEDTNLIIEVLPLLENSVVKGMQKVYSAGENANKIYFLVKGRVNFLLKNEKTTFQVFSERGYFGDVETILGIPRLNSAETATECRFLIMGIELLRNVQKYFPGFYLKVKEAAIARMKVTQKAKVEMKTLLKLNKSANLNKRNLHTIRDIIRRKTGLINLDNKLKVNKSIQIKIASQRLKMTSEYLIECQENAVYINTLLNKLRAK